MGKTIQIKRGPKNTMPTLAQGELGMTTDSGAEGLFIGTGTENIELAKKSDLNISGQISTHNSNSSAHSDIRKSVTTHTGNTSIHVTAEEKNAWNAKLDSYTETDPTVPAWAKAKSKPSYTASEVGADPSGSASQALTDAKSYTDTQIAAIPTPDVSGQIGTHNTDSSAHSDIRSSITTHTGNTSIHVTSDQKTAWDAKATTSYVDQKISEIPTPDVSGQIGTHNTNTEAHNDIRKLITGLTTRLNTLADSDDTTLDQLSEIVAYIKNNKSLIDGITTSKVNVADIINNLTTNVTNKPLSAAQGVALKALIDAITVPTKVSELTNDSGYLTSFTETDPTVPAWAKAASKPTYTASEVGAVPTSRKVNGKTLSSDITLSASDVSARPSSWTPSASDVGAVPTSRKVNGKALSSDITLSASDVGLGNVGNFKAVSTVASQGLTDTEKSNARANIGAGTSSLTIGTTASTAAAGNHTHTAANVGAVPTSRTVNGKALSANITLSASDVGAAPVSHTSDSTIHVTTEEKATWNAKADAQFKPAGKSYLTFSSPNSFTLAVYDATKHWNGTLEYFASDKTWTVWDGTSTLTAIDNDGEYVLYLRGTGNTVITGNNANYRWIITGSDISCIGNIEYLLDYAIVQSGNHPTMAPNCYYCMFQDCTALTQAPALPATTLAKSCYSNMFNGCTSLTQAPALPATTLEGSCYYSMFQGCTSLIQAPALPATTLANYCYNNMFLNCTSLIQAPALPATTLAISCYTSMFQGCTSLIQAPALPATTLAESCYNSMFINCTSLTQAPALPATTLKNYCYQYMFIGCTSLTQAPALPATTLADSCYYRMFYSCTRIKLSSTKTGEYTQEYRIPSTGEGTTAENALTEMFNYTGGTFTGTPEINTTYYLSSSNMVVRDTDVATLNGYVGSMIDGVTPSTLGLDKSALLKSVEVAFPATANWRSVTFGNNRFVAVADYSNIAAYSDDGINWTQTSILDSKPWWTVTFGNNCFVVVVNGSNRAAYSYDGITWTQTIIPATANWTSVTFGNNRFVAIASSSNIAAYSDDGINWTQTTLPASINWKSVTFGNNRFVAIAYESNIAAYSDDGINWTQTTLPSSAHWMSATFGNNRFVVTASDSNKAAYSDDGINWIQTTLPVSESWYSVTFGNNRFVAIAYNSNIAAYSDDGITWTQTTLPASTNWNSVTFGNNRFVAVARNSTIIAYSYDGITWYNTADVLTYPDNTDIKDRLKSVLGIDQSVSLEEKAKWNAKADAPFKPSGKSYLTFSSPNSFTLKVNDATKHWDGTLEYFAEDKTWTVWDGTTTLSSVENNGEYVLYLRGIGNTVITGGTSDYGQSYQWVLTGTNISCSGNIETLLDYTTIESGNHPTMANYCYSGMFKGCTSLIRAPELPATTLVERCYQRMFMNCTDLVQVPTLPATTLAFACYRWMFQGCTSLIRAPELPATTLANCCYISMFQGCTSLIRAPALPATTLADHCYMYMFSSCTSLTQAPALPATTLADHCYYYMFKGCAKIKVSSIQTGEYTVAYRIPASGTGTTATDALLSMFDSTGGTFTGTPEINMTYYLSSENMVVRETDIATLNGYVGSMIDAAIGNAIGGSY